MATAVPGAQSDLGRHVISDGKVPIPSLLRADDNLVVIEFAAFLRPEAGELHLRKTLSKELDDLSINAPLIALVSVTGSRSFLTRGDTDINTLVSVKVDQMIKTSELPFHKLGTTFSFLEGGGELNIGHAKVRIKGYAPFPTGGRYVMWFVRSSDTQPIVAIDWMSVAKGRLVGSNPPTWRDVDMGKTRLFGLPVDWFISELRSRQK
jgi:hypothetical protein